MDSHTTNFEDKVQFLLDVSKTGNLYDIDSWEETKESICNKITQEFADEQSDDILPAALLILEQKYLSKAREELADIEQDLLLEKISCIEKFERSTLSIADIHQKICVEPLSDNNSKEDEVPVFTSRPKSRWDKELFFVDWIRAPLSNISRRLDIALSTRLPNRYRQEKSADSALFIISLYSQTDTVSESQKQKLRQSLLKNAQKLSPEKQAAFSRFFLEDSDRAPKSVSQNSPKHSLEFMYALSSLNEIDNDLSEDIYSMRKNYNLSPMQNKDKAG